MIYANRNWYAQNLDMDRLGDYQLWLAQYSNVPDFPYLFYRLAVYQRGKRSRYYRTGRP